MKIKLKYRGYGFEAEKEVTMPLIFQNMLVSISLDDGFSGGPVLFEVATVTYLLNHKYYEATLRVYEILSSSKTKLEAKLKPLEFEAEGWTIAKNPTFQPIE